MLMSHLASCSGSVLRCPAESDRDFDSFSSSYLRAKQIFISIREFEPGSQKCLRWSHFLFQVAACDQFRFGIIYFLNNHIRGLYLNHSVCVGGASS